jgi:hypothetical protein
VGQLPERQGRTGDGTSSITPAQQQKVSFECDMKAFDEN